jgi:hypothetical protein
VKIEAVRQDIKKNQRPAGLSAAGPVYLIQKMRNDFIPTVTNLVDPA